jgi:hypothetical protein
MIAPSSQYTCLPSRKSSSQRDLGSVSKIRGPVASQAKIQAASQMTRQSEPQKSETCPSMCETCEASRFASPMEFSSCPGPDQLKLAGMDASRGAFTIFPPQGVGTVEGGNAASICTVCEESRTASPMEIWSDDPWMASPVGASINDSRAPVSDPGSSDPGRVLDTPAFCETCEESCSASPMHICHDDASDSADSNQPGTNSVVTGL